VKRVGNLVASLASYSQSHGMRKILILIAVFLRIYVDKAGSVPTKNEGDVHALGSQSPLGRKGKVGSLLAQPAVHHIQIGSRNSEGESFCIRERLKIHSIANDYVL
jgi:hypothetical protein